MTVPSLGLGLVGCGSFGAYVLDAVAGLPGLHLAAVADPEPSRAKPLGDRHGVAALDGLDALLGTEGVDVIALATPPATHAGMAVAALRAGKHVFCEKPLATTTEDAARVRDEADRSAGTLVVDHVLRYNRSSAASGSESAHWHAANGLGRTGPWRTRPRGSDTHPVRGPIPGGQFPGRPGQVGVARGDGEALNHHSGGAGAPHTGTAPGVPDRTATLPRPPQGTASPRADHHTIELNRPYAGSPATSYQPICTPSPTPTAANAS
ncbi:Gfo/Idh/MocA family protein [Streptomyces sp. 061-3]|uniref:Gfo/Idh/MocA family protein n=1 Tax=Streptomyces sp. 061-3 TaxID=2789268 RepID=UPI0039817607